MANITTSVTTQINTGITVIGHNYQTYKFLNGEQYKLYFYVDYFDNRIAMTIFDLSNNILIDNRQLTLSGNLCQDVSELQGYFTVTGNEPTVSTIDNTSILSYMYQV